MHGDQQPCCPRAAVRAARRAARLLVTMHELLLDGWGATVLFQRLAELYATRPQGPDPERATRYDRYLEHQRRLLDTEEVAEAGRYWSRRLAGELPVLELARKQRPATPGYHGATVEAVLDADLTRRLNETALAASATAFVPLLAAYALALGYYGDAEEVIVGAPMAGRERPEAADVPAFTLAMLPLRLRMDPDVPLAEFTAQVRETVHDAYAAADHPFGWTLRRLPRPPAAPPRRPSSRRCSTCCPTRRARPRRPASDSASSNWTPATPSTTARCTSSRTAPTGCSSSTPTSGNCWRHRRHGTSWPPP
ncbi:condensation domain-containing protein [Streptomyces cinnamoneus]|uniref:condensation domain-containing protein n=1 Tax=Streptomyces cinnamoneus TaxID=53446 RepID=UPI0018659FBC|nr:condensation domain-containing protein [Streptomyces cinnamoneus]